MAGNAVAGDLPAGLGLRRVNVIVGFDRRDVGAARGGVDRAAPDVIAGPRVSGPVGEVRFNAQVVVIAFLGDEGAADVEADHATLDVGLLDEDGKGLLPPVQRQGVAVLCVGPQGHANADILCGFGDRAVHADEPAGEFAARVFFRRDQQAVGRRRFRRDGVDQEVAARRRRSGAGVVGEDGLGFDAPFAEAVQLGRRQRGEP